MFAQNYNHSLAVKRKVSARKSKALSLKEIIIQSILDKKGEKIVSLDMRKIDDSFADTFIICEADNTMQVKAIADNVMIQTEMILGENPWHHEGLQRLEWVLIDYVDVVVHIFLSPARSFYQLEELWHDAKREEH